MREPSDQRIHLPPRLTNPMTRPAPMAINTAMSGLRSIEASRSELAPERRSFASAAPSDSFWRAESTAPKTCPLPRCLGLDQLVTSCRQLRHVGAQDGEIGGGVLRRFLHHFCFSHAFAPQLALNGAMKR